MLESAMDKQEAQGTEGSSRARREEMISRLKERGFRLTPQRLAVVEILSMSSGHPSVERIYEEVRKRFPTTSLATVYKTVSVLKELREVLELGFPDGSNRYDGKKPYPHPHLICMKCRSVTDPDIPGLEQMAEELGRSYGYRVLHHRLDFFGLCPRCRED
jgi:Fur family peroxide stress response transcriptional regulator